MVLGYCSAINVIRPSPKYSRLSGFEELACRKSTTHTSWARRKTRPRWSPLDAAPCLETRRFNSEWSLAGTSRNVRRVDKDGYIRTLQCPTRYFLLLADLPPSKRSKPKSRPGLEPGSRLLDLSLSVALTTRVIRLLLELCGAISGSRPRKHGTAILQHMRKMGPGPAKPTTVHLSTMPTQPH